MRNKFEVGDRVAVYQFGLRYTGTVCGTETNGPTLSVRIDNTDVSHVAHLKQCRLLKKREAPKEVWIYIPSLDFGYTSVTAYTDPDVARAIVPNPNLLAKFRAVKR